MIIYGEELPAGLTAGDLNKGGAAYSRWPEMEKGLISRAQQQITVEPIPAH